MTDTIGSTSRNLARRVSELESELSLARALLADWDYQPTAKDLLGWTDVHAAIEALKNDVGIYRTELRRTQVMLMAPPGQYADEIERLRVDLTSGRVAPATDYAEDLKNALAAASDLRRQLALMEEHERGEVWRWQGDGMDHLETMGNRMGVLIPAPDLREFVGLLRESATTFRRYEALHRAKGTAESTEKAEVNAAIAGRIEAAIGAPGMGVGGSHLPANPPSSPPPSSNHQFQARP